MLKIEKEHAAEMIAHALEEDPNECCGILSGKDGLVSHVYRITNTARSPYRYLMDPQEFLNADKDSESKGREFLAFYHSHTHSPAYPSQTDVRMGAGEWMAGCILRSSVAGSEVQPPAKGIPHWGDRRHPRTGISAGPEPNLCSGNPPIGGGRNSNRGPLF